MNFRMESKIDTFRKESESEIINIRIKSLVTLGVKNYFAGHPLFRRGFYDFSQRSNARRGPTEWMVGEYRRTM